MAVWVILLGIWEAAYRIAPAGSGFVGPSRVLDATLHFLNIQSGFGEPLDGAWPRRRSDGGAAMPFIRTGGSVIKSQFVLAHLMSGTRLVVGLVASISLGIALGAALWRWPELDQLLGGLFLGMQTLPSVCWVPLAVMIFGISEVAVLFVLVMGSFFAIAISLRDGLRTIPPLYQRAGRMLGARGWKLYWYVLLPASMPAMASSLRQGFSFAWRSLMGAELILAVSYHGLGFLLAGSRNNPSQIVSVMLMMVLIGMAMDRLVFAQLQERVGQRFGLAA